MPWSSMIHRREEECDEVRRAVGAGRPLIPRGIGREAARWLQSGSIHSPTVERVLAAAAPHRGANRHGLRSEEAVRVILRFASELPPIDFSSIGVAQSISVLHAGCVINRSLIIPSTAERRPRIVIRDPSAASHRIPTVQALVARAVSNRDGPAHITRRGVAHQRGM